MPRARTALLAAAIVAATAGCSTAVAGTGSPTPLDRVDGAGPFTRDAGALDVSAVLGEDYYALDLAAAPDGTAVALLGEGALPDGDGTVVADLVATDGGPELGDTVLLPHLDDDATLHVGPDGTAVVLGGLEEEDGYPLVLATVAPGAREAEVRDFEPMPAWGSPRVAATALSPDGRTLFATLHYAGAEAPGNQLVAVDVATAQVTDSTIVDLAARGGNDAGYATYAYELAASRDGGVTLHASVDRDAEGDTNDVVLVRYDADLEPTGDPLPLLPDVDVSITRSVLPLPGGGTLAVAVDGIHDSPRARLFVVRDGAIEQVIELDELLGVAVAPDDVAVDPNGRHVLVPYETPDGRAGVATVDLATGEVAGDVTLCEDGGVDQVALTSGTSAVVSVQCRVDGEDGPEELRLLG